MLLAGDCLGGFDALIKKVAAVNKKNGPFDLLLCVGQFFEEASKWKRGLCCCLAMTQQERELPLSSVDNSCQPQQ